MEFAKNRKAFFDYEILDKYEAGIVLKGYEVKSIRNGRLNLKGGYVTLRDGEAWLTNIEIQPYQMANQDVENLKRKRKLLLNKREIAKLEHHSNTPGTTIVPLRMFLKGRTIKVQLGVCRGKKQHDKRNVIKNRDLDRELRRRLKN